MAHQDSFKQRLQFFTNVQAAVPLPKPVSNHSSALNSSTTPRTFAAIPSSKSGTQISSFVHGSAENLSSGLAPKSGGNSTVSSNTALNTPSPHYSVKITSYNRFAGSTPKTSKPFNSFLPTSQQSNASPIGNIKDRLAKFEQEQPHQQANADSHRPAQRRTSQSNRNAPYQRPSVTQRTPGATRTSVTAPAPIPAPVAQPHQQEDDEMPSAAEMEAVEQSSDPMDLSTRDALNASSSMDIMEDSKPIETVAHADQRVSVHNRVSVHERPVAHEPIIGHVEQQSVHAQPQITPLSTVHHNANRFHHDSPASSHSEPEVKVMSAVPIEVKSHYQMPSDIKAHSHANSEVKPHSHTNSEVKGHSAFPSNASGSNPKCATCAKTVYVVEQVVLDTKVYHKACFKCEHCHNQLKMGNFAALGGKYYCKPHFKQLFRLKGNYSEGFGEEEPKRAWLNAHSNQPSSSS